MTHKWAALGTLGLLAALAASGATAPQNQKAGEAAPVPPVQKEHVDKQQIVPSLMVMSSKRYTYEGGKLTLHGVSPTTIIFADRPKRLAGSVPTPTFVADWSEGKDSFEKVPPNADVSVFHPDGAKNAVVELKNPVLKGDDLTYDVKLLKGELAPSGPETSVFIDIIGEPWTPMSYAGVARRSAARAAYFSSPHVVVY